MFIEKSGQRSLNYSVYIFLELVLLGRVVPAGLLGLLGWVLPAGLLGLLVAGLIPRVFFTASAAPCAIFFTWPPVYTPKVTINISMEYKPINYVNIIH